MFSSSTFRAVACLLWLGLALLCASQAAMAGKPTASTQRSSAESALSDMPSAWAGKPARTPADRRDSVESIKRRPLRACNLEAFVPSLPGTPDAPWRALCDVSSVDAPHGVTLSIFAADSHHSACRTRHMTLRALRGRAPPAPMPQAG